MVSIGVGIGLMAAAALTQLMTSQLFGVAPLDVPTHVTVALILAVAAGLAAYLSTRHVATLDPVVVLKSE